jgi:hypothetical protein
MKGACLELATDRQFVHSVPPRGRSALDPVLVERGLEALETAADVQMRAGSASWLVPMGHFRANARKQGGDTLCQIVQEMPAIGYLPCLGSSFLCSCRKFTPAVTTDDLDLWMVLQPGAHGLNRAIRQHVQWLARVQITDQRPIASLAFIRSVVSSTVSGGRSGCRQIDLAE